STACLSCLSDRLAEGWIAWESSKEKLGAKSRFYNLGIVRGIDPTERSLGGVARPYWPPSVFFSGGFSSFLGSALGNGGGGTGFKSGAAPVWGGFTSLFSSFFGSSFFSTSRSFRSFNNGSTVHLETRYVHFSNAFSCFNFSSCLEIFSLNFL